MVRIDAGPDIALMKNKQTIGNIAEMKHPGYSMGASLFISTPTDMYLSVASTISSSRPQPAISAFIDAAPETINKRCVFPGDIALAATVLATEIFTDYAWLYHELRFTGKTCAEWHVQQL